MVGRPKSRNMELTRVVDVSETLIRLASKLLPSPQLVAAALALALGRVASVPGVDFEAVMALVRIGRAGENLDEILKPSEDEEAVAASAAKRKKTRGSHGT